MFGMEKVHFISFLVLIFVFFVCSTKYDSVAHSEGFHQSLPCQVRLKCPETEDVIYASEGEQCYVFWNACTLRNENCVRHNFFFKTLRPLDADACRALCSRICSQETEAVCAEYHGKNRTFTNYCSWAFHVCTTGQLYKNPYPGKCEGDTEENMYDW